jgi:hypothetical protein
MTTGSQYSRMPGRSGFFVRNSLWMGADHVLSVRRNPFSESYRRYYFTDVQAIVLAEIPDTLEPYGYIAAALLVLTAGALVYTRHPVWGTLSALTALVAFFVSWRSANCAGYLKTSVSIEKLPSLRRRGDAAKTMAMVKAQIERTQGIVNPELLEAYTPAISAGRVVSPQPALRHCGGQVHWMVFALMLVRGVITAISLKGATSSVPLSIVSGVVGSVILLLLVLAAIQQRHSDLALGVRRLVYATLAFYVASGLASFAVSIYIAIRLVPRNANPAMLMNNPAIKAYALVDLVGFCVLGCTGLILMRRHRHAVRTPPPLAMGSGG